MRAVQRLRRNRGFAFSQCVVDFILSEFIVPFLIFFSSSAALYRTEEGQEKVIRSYDTTIKKKEG